MRSTIYLTPALANFRLEGQEIISKIELGQYAVLTDRDAPLVLRPGQRLIATLTVGEHVNTLQVEIADAEEADAPAIVEKK